MTTVQLVSYMKNLKNITSGEMEIPQIWLEEEPLQDYT